MAVVPRIGTEFAGYRIEALLGRGGMSVVYRAENARLGNRVALKLLAEELADDESFRERFVRESRTAAALNHPNIVTIYDAGDEDGVLYIAMRYVETDLKQVLGRNGPLSIAATLGVIGQVGSALDAAHSRGLLHRDVKPANVLLDRASEPGGVPHAYLADFGLTKHLESRSGITASGQFVGTIDYMSPEQIEGRDVDGRTDIYSLGCVLFECLTSATPFRRETEVAVLWAHMREDPPAVTELRPELPGAVDLVVARAVAKDPANRYTTARELVEELQAALEGVPDAMTRVAVAEPKVPTLAAPPAAPRRRRWIGPLVRIGALLLASAIAIAVYELVRDPEPQIIPGERTTLSDRETFLLGYVPRGIREQCNTTEPPSPEFIASVVCRPGPPLEKVEYSLPESGAGMSRYFERRIHAEQLESPPYNLSSAVNCSTPQPVKEWRSAGELGHRPGETEGSPQGRFICYRHNWWAAVEWTDARVDVYGVAYGDNMGRLFDWWRREAGPVRREAGSIRD